MPSPTDLLAQSLRIFIKYFLNILPFWFIQGIFILSLVLCSNLYLNQVLIFSPGLIFLLLAWIVIHLWFFTLFMIQLSSLTQDRPIPVRNLFKKSELTTVSFITTCFILSLLLIGGTVLFLIPGLIFYVWFGFSPYIIISQKTSIIGSIVHSYRLTKNHFWLVAKYLFFPIIFSVLSLFAASVLAEPISFLKPVVILCAIPVVSVFVIYNYLVYFAFKRHFSFK